MVASDLDVSEGRALITRAVEGDQSSWNTLVDRYKNLVYSIPFRAGLSRTDSEDVTQDTFICLMEQIGRVDPTRVSAWLVGVARNKTREVWRKNGRNAVANLPYPHFDEALEKVERAIALAQEMETISGAQRVIVTAMLENEDVTDEMLAHRTGLKNADVVRKTRNRAILALKARIWR